MTTTRSPRFEAFTLAAKARRIARRKSSGYNRWYALAELLESYGRGLSDHGQLWRVRFVVRAIADSLQLAG